MEKDTPSVDILIATFNEEKYIQKCVQAVLNQTYPSQNMNIFIIDGGSTDKTPTIIKELANSNNNITILKNPMRYQAHAWNVAIKGSFSPYISIISAHSIIPSNYLENAIEILQNKNIVLTGGHMVAKGEGLVSCVIACLHHSKFGIGVGKFHDLSFEGFTDTVYTHNLKRAIINKVGMFNTNLDRNQDIELTGRIRAAGGLIFLSSQLDTIYIPRNSVFSFIKQYFRNARFLFETTYITKNALSLRHFIPLFFVVFIILSFYLLFNTHIVVWSLVLISIWLFYFTLDLFFSVKLSKSIKQFILLFVFHPLLHIVYGLGTFWGGLNLLFKPLTKILKKNHV